MVVKEKVLVVYPFYAHYRGPIINSLLNNDKYEYYFIGGNATPKRYSSLKLHDFNNDARFNIVENLWLFNYFLIQFSVLKYINKYNVDKVIFLADWKYISYWFYVLYCRYRGIKCFFWSHGLLNEKRTVNNFLKFQFHKLFNGGAVYSMRSKKIMLKLGYTKKIWVVNNSLDFCKQKDTLNNTLNSKNLKDTSKYKPYIIFTGRLIKERNLELLFEALKHLKALNVHLNVVILGSGPHEDNLKNYSKDLGIMDNTFFKGSCYDENLLCNFFINSEMCVFPGPIGLSIIHSMTYGVPVITNDNLDLQKPEIEALKDGYNGFLFKDGDYKDLSRVIFEFYNLNQEEKKKMKHNCQVTIEHNYTPEFQRSVFNQMLNS
ncbi:glycosyltransferase [Sphingobacterium composti Ten et al. 2007 non Yoo et al. 2007]|uniref:glycosyltransferase n=1 Tax=Sphingobacterium composti TaxID=363260 RepID=UPI00135A4207|nr:glycosyltransferase [Sphingobacterium composti Ten et al. 2007 non Yoo et al. 2007]